METTSAIPRPEALEAILGKLPEDTGSAVLEIIGGYQRSVGELTGRVGELTGIVSELELLIRIREEQLRLARIDKYGPRGEKLNPAQILLLNLEPGVQLAEVEKEAARPDAEKQAAVAAAAAAAGPQRKTRAAYSKTHPGRAPLPAHLPRREIILTCEEAPCGRLIGYETKEELVIQPAEFYVQVIKREPKPLAGAEIDSEERAARRAKAA